MGLTQQSAADQFEEKVIAINRVAKVVKGGKRFSFSALVVVGNGKGTYGVGFGKANEVPEAIRKAVERAEKSLETVPMQGATISHQVFGRYAGGRVLMRPASPGTGVIAGGPVRAIMEAVGIKDILTKSLGSQNAINIVRATVQGLRQLKDRKSVSQLRGIPMEELW